jgi:aryl-alcohol dehydrogenase-like predicted oxidoreductase
MNYRNLGRTGLKISTICLGTMQFGWSADEATSYNIMDKAVELGCNFFDTANVYSHWVEGNDGGVSETIIGRWLQQSNLRRQDIVLATKVRGDMGSGPNEQGLSRVHIMQAVEDSLNRLQTDYIDLYQVHWPDEETPLEETLSTLNDLVRSGKVRYIGCSNYPAWLFMKSLWVSDANGYERFDSIQPHYSYVHRAEFERETQAVCADQGIGVIPYSPLAAGFLTGKYRRDTDIPDSVRADGIKSKYMNEQGFAAIDKLEEIGSAHNASIAQTAIAWILANPTVSSAIIGANNTDQLADTMKGADIELSAEEKAALDEVTVWD